MAICYSSDRQLIQVMAVPSPSPASSAHTRSVLGFSDILSFPGERLVDAALKETEQNLLWLLEQTRNSPKPPQNQKAPTGCDLKEHLESHFLAYCLRRPDLQAAIRPCFSGLLGRAQPFDGAGGWVCSQMGLRRSGTTTPKPVPGACSL